MRQAVFKARLPNRDARRGTRGGYRCLYYLKTDGHLVLLTIYAKTEKSDLSSADIRRIFAEVGE